jgi:hypothetical protein
MVSQKRAIASTSRKFRLRNVLVVLKKKDEETAKQS